MPNYLHQLGRCLARSLKARSLRQQQAGFMLMLLYELKFRIFWIDLPTEPMAMKVLYNIYNERGVYYCNKYEIIVRYACYTIL